MVIASRVICIGIKEIKMKNVYLYGASDDCHEIETDFDSGFESYVDIRIKNSKNKEVIAKYIFDGDWGVQLLGDIPKEWKIKTIEGNCAVELRYKENAGNVIHIQIPDDETLIFEDKEYD